MSDLVAAASSDLDELLAHIRRSRNFDFTGYKRSSLVRRIERRMRNVGCASFGDYQDHLEVHPEEFGELFDTILINVTRFFRDVQTWQYLSDEIVPRLVTGKVPGEGIRIWSAGCATGQEAYSLAMMFCEALGTEQFRARVKIYGTDADEAALAKARQAAYSPKELEDVPLDYRSRYFEPVNGSQVFRNDLRRQVIFGRHNLVQDAPISRLDLLLCRNTLMYFNADTQDKIVERFHFALSEFGYLTLGKAETLLTRSSIFRPVDLRLRVFTKSSDGHRNRPILVGGRFEVEADDAHVDVRDLAIDTMAMSTIVLDAAGNVTLINAAARQQFGLRLKDIGAAIQDLEISYRPIDLRTAISEATASRRPVERTGVRWTGADDEARILNIEVTPLIDDNMVVGTSIAFTDVRLFHSLQADLERANRDLETAYEELQSTNEELETTNEELQSTNDELQSSNEELQVSSGELDRAKLYLEGIVTGLRRGVVVLGLDLNVRLWNHWAEELWGLRAAEVRGQSLFELDFGLPVSRLRAAIRSCLEGTSQMEERTVAATNRKGQRISCRVVCSALALAGAVEGVILLMEEVPVGQGTD